MNSGDLGAVAMHLLRKGMAQVTVTGNGRERLLVRLQVGSGLEPGDATAEGTAEDWAEAWRIVTRGVEAIVRAQLCPADRRPEDALWLAGMVCRRYGMEPGTAAQAAVTRWAEKAAGPAWARPNGRALALEAAGVAELVD